MAGSENKTWEDGGATVTTQGLESWLHLASPFPQASTGDPHPIPAWSGSSWRRGPFKAKPTAWAASLPPVCGGMCCTKQKHILQQQGWGYTVSPLRPRGTGRGRFGGTHILRQKFNSKTQWDLPCTTHWGRAWGESRCVEAQPSRAPSSEAGRLSLVSAEVKEVREVWTRCVEF